MGLALFLSFSEEAGMGKGGGKLLLQVNILDHLECIWKMQAWVLVPRAENKLEINSLAG